MNSEHLDLAAKYGLQLLDYCGGGAFGDVYFCKDISDKTMVLKIISKKKIGDSWQKELNGVKKYREITENNPELLKVFYVAENEENFFYTMEAADSVSQTGYVPDSLALRLKSGALPPEELQPVLSGILHDIKLIHAANSAHRDIKPDNILFKNGVPKLADIGLVSSLDNTMTMLAGTADFIPPEVRSAGASYYSDPQSRQRNDLYAFGKVIYCAATGMDAGEYPATPPEMPLDSLPLKLFLQLSYELCSKDRISRLDSLKKLENEFEAINRKLQHGETFLDKQSYFLKRCFKIRYALIFAVLCILGCICICFCKRCHKITFFEKVCDECVIKFKNLSLTRKLNQFQKKETLFYDDKLAPYLLDHIADEWKAVLNTVPKEYSGNKEFFDRLYQQCRLICNIKSAQIANSNIGKFAKAYLDFYHSSISIKITGIRARKARETKVNVKIDKCDFGVGDRRICSENIDRKVGHIEENIKLDSSITMKPWERVSVWIMGHIGLFQNNGRTYFNPQGKMHLAEVEDEFDCVSEARLHGFDYLHIKFKIISGKGFPDLLNEIFGTNTPSRNVIRNTF